MSQITIRAPEELVKRVKAAAAESNTSMNEYVNMVLDAATDSDLAGSEAERVRERLARAGLIAAPSEVHVAAPDPDSLQQAAQRAAHGRPLSDLVSEGR